MEERLLDAANNTSGGEKYGELIEVKPWTRFWARILDYIIFVSLVFILTENILKFQLDQ